MAKYSLYRRGKVWWFGVMVDGKQQCFSTRCESREHAEHVVEMKLGAIKGVSMQNILDYYISENPNRSDYTIKFVKYFMKRFATFCGDEKGMATPASGGSIFKIQGYQKHLALRNNPTSIRIELSAIRSVFLSAHRAGLIKYNPFVGVRLPTPNSRLYFLNSEDISKLLKASQENPLYMNYIKFLLYTGCRGGEFRTLTWENIHDNYLKFDGKSGVRRFPINEDVSGILTAIKSFSRKPLDEHVFTCPRTGKWICTHSQISKIVKKYVRSAKLDERYTAHSLRHTYASHLVMQGTDLFSVSKLLGHKSVKMTEKYAHLQPELLKTRVQY